MARKFFYTVCIEYRMSIPVQGEIPMKLHSWLQDQRCCDPQTFALINDVVNACGFGCKIQTYCTAYLLDCKSQPTLAASADDKDTAYHLLCDMIPQVMFENIISPKYHPEAQKCIDKWMSTHTVGCKYKPYTIQPYATN